MTTSHRSGQDNALQTILALACARFSWDAKKLVLLHKQNRPIDKLSEKATSVFKDLGIIEPDQKDGQLVVSNDYAQLVRNLTVGGLSKQFPEEGHGTYEVKSQKKRRHPRPSEEDRNSINSPPASGVQRIARRSSDEEMEELRTA